MHLQKKWIMNVFLLEKYLKALISLFTYRIHTLSNVCSSKQEMWSHSFSWHPGTGDTWTPPSRWRHLSAWMCLLHLTTDWLENTSLSIYVSTKKCWDRLQNLVVCIFQQNLRADLTYINLRQNKDLWWVLCWEFLWNI